MARLNAALIRTATSQLVRVRLFVRRIGEMIPSRLTLDASDVVAGPCVHFDFVANVHKQRNLNHFPSF